MFMDLTIFSGFGFWFGLAGIVFGIVKTYQLRKLNDQMRSMDQKIGPLHVDFEGKRDFQKKLIEENLERVKKDIELSRRVDVASLPLQDFQINSLPWKVYDERAIVISIVSGKGGVGKSTVALALANKLAKTRDVLIVDFDLHNRGLTSRYKPGIAKGDDSLMNWISRYLEAKIRPNGVDPQDGVRVKNLLARDDFVEIRRRFAFRDLVSEDHYVHRTVKIGRGFEDNLRFLPSRSVESPFLASPESRMDVVDVAAFVQVIARFSQERGLGRFLIIDCHGGQDMFMAGAIVASDMVVTVLKPEPGSFEGARELLGISKRLVDEQTFTPIKSVLVINECQQGTGAIVDEIKGALKDSVESIFQVERQDAMSLPDFDPTGENVSKIGSLANAIEGLANIALEIRNLSAPRTGVIVPQSSGPGTATTTDTSATPGVMQSVSTRDSEAAATSESKARRTKDIHESEFSYTSSGTFPTDDK
jgi:cellulose biosynthesis protein BcsQ